MKRSDKELFIIIRRIRLTKAVQCLSDKRNPLARGRFRKLRALSGTRVRGLPLKLRAAAITGKEQLADY